MRSVMILCVALVLGAATGCNKDLEAKLKAAEDEVAASPAANETPAADAPTPSAPAPWLKDLDEVKSQLTEVEKRQTNMEALQKATDGNINGLIKVAEGQKEQIGKLLADGNELREYVGKVDNIAVSAHVKASDALEENAASDKRMDALIADLADTKENMSGLKKELAEAKEALKKSVNEETLARARADDRLEKLAEADRQAGIARSSRFERTAQAAKTRLVQAELAAEKADKTLKEKEAQRRRLEERVKKLESQPPFTVEVEVVQPRRGGLIRRR